MINNSHHQKSCLVNILLLNDYLILRKNEKGAVLAQVLGVEDLF